MNFSRGNYNMDRFINSVYHEDARRLLPALPSASIDNVIADPMFGVARNPKRKATYDWGPDPCNGDPDKWWAYHGHLYRECLRVLKPGGKLAWAMGVKFRDHFAGWFGGNRLWSLTCYQLGAMNSFGSIWLVQTREQEPVPFPDRDSLIILPGKPKLLVQHPCPKSVEEMSFLIENLSKPNDIILDCFSGTGTTLVAAKKVGRRFIGCDRSRAYCQAAMEWLARKKV
jgi:DNA modification methylase